MSLSSPSRNPSPSVFVTLNSVAARTPDDRTLFHDLTLAFGREGTGVVGRNGSGKSTLLRLIAGEAAANSVPAVMRPATKRAAIECISSVSSFFLLLFECPLRQRTKCGGICASTFTHTLFTCVYSRIASKPISRP